MLTAKHNTVRALFCLLVAGAIPAAVASDYEVVVVEETWAVHVVAPESSNNAPQLSTTMGPRDSTDGLHFLFTLNYLSEPSYAPGGMQLQVWNGEQLQSQKTGPLSGVMAEGEETVRWTQRMSVHNGTLVMEVVDGTSQSWGNFGGQGYLRVTAPWASPHLNDYRPRLSLTESGVGYGGNRVESFVLERVHWTLADGRSYEYLAPIDIDSDLDPN